MLHEVRNTQTFNGTTSVKGERWSNPDFPNEIVSHTHSLDTRNVIDYYKTWTDEDIREDLHNSALPFNIVAENFAHDFNIATLVRNANAFNMKGVTLLGRKKWDKRGAVGVYNYTPVHHRNDAEIFYSNIHNSGAPLIVVDNVDGAENITDFCWPEGEIHVVFGQESIGVSNLSLSYATHCIQIPQRGSVRSLNVGVSSGIVMYDYLSKL